MTDTEQAVNKVFNPYRPCIDCGRPAYGGDYCAVCRDLKDGEPYSLADVLNESPRFNYTLLVCLSALIFALLTWLICR